MSKKNSLHQVSTIISSYNGLPLLKKYLDNVMAEAQPEDEILITDDNGTDLTIPYYKTQYDLPLVRETEQFQLFRGPIQTGRKKLILTLVNNKKNLRFGANNNQAVGLALYDLVFIINNDCAPQKGCLKQLLTHFQGQPLDLSPKSPFAVTALEISPHQNNTQHGKNKLWFTRGRFQHSKGDDWRAGPTAWANGGSTLYNRPKFLALGGFDKLYYPAYWEDIDLSYQARKKGWQVLFEPKAIIHHNHETTNQTVFGQHKIDEMSWQNGSKFTWKNGTLKQKIQFIAWQPYWLIKRKPFWIWFLLIIVAAALMRLAQLGTLPEGLTWDEAAIAYNGWSVWGTRRDEWLIRLPLSFRSFGDYKAPAAIYLSGAFSQLFGLNPFVWRLPYALAGILSVWGFMLYLKLLFREHPWGQQLALLGGLSMAVTPWHFFFSRVGFESGLALCLIIWGIYLGSLYFYNSAEHLNQRWYRFWQLALGAMLLTGSFYVYHSSKVVAPILMVGIVLFFGRKVFNHRFGQIMIALLISFLALVPFGYDAIHGEGLTRANSSFLTDPQFDVAQKIDLTLGNFSTQLHPQFLAFGQGDVEGARHSALGGWGLFLWPTALVIGIGFLVGGWQALGRQKLISKKIYFWALFWLAAGLLPAAITNDIPHFNRALLALPGFLILFVLGLAALINLARQKNRILVSKSIIYATLLLTILFGVGYLNYYFHHYQSQAATAYNAGYLPAFKKTWSLEKEVDRILFTAEYGQPYIYAILAKPVNPYFWQGGSLIKFEFTDNLQLTDLDRHNALVVVGQKDQATFTDALAQNNYPQTQLIEQITDQSGQIRFLIYRTPYQDHHDENTD